MTSLFYGKGLRVNHGPNRDKLIIAIKNSSGKKPWTIIYLEEDDPDFFEGMILSDQDVENWDKLSYSQS